MSTLEVATYTHADGRQEEVEIRSFHPEVSAFTIFVPSLNRERQTTETRLKKKTSITRNIQDFPAPKRTNCKPVEANESLRTGQSRPPAKLNNKQVILGGSASEWPMAISSSKIQDATLNVESKSKDVAFRPMTSLPSEYSYHLSIPENSPHASMNTYQQQQKNNRPSAQSSGTSPWSWSGGKANGGYAEIVDGVFGVGVASCPSMTSQTKDNLNSNDTSVYSKMLQATKSYEGQLVQEQSAVQNVYSNPIEGKLCTPQNNSYHAEHVREYSAFSNESVPSFEVTSHSDGTYRPAASATTSLFAAVGNRLRNYGSIEKGYRSLHAVPEDKPQEQTELEDVEPKYKKPREPVDVMCNPECCTLS